jgi:spoIIIJ-associated protein
MTNLEKDSGPAVRKIEDFIQILTGPGGLELQSNILACNGHVRPDSGKTAGEPLAATNAISAPDIKVELTGPDTTLLLNNNGELLHAIEHIAARMLRLEHEDNDRISFDAAGFKAARDRNLQQSAEAAIQRVRATGQPWAFPPMSSRERRMVHLILAASGLPTASSGEGPRRFVVLYPEGHQPAPPVDTQKQTADRTQAIRNRFRPR